METQQYVSKDDAIGFFQKIPPVALYSRDSMFHMYRVQKYIQRNTIALRESTGG